MGSDHSRNPKICGTGFRALGLEVQKLLRDRKYEGTLWSGGMYGKSVSCSNLKGLITYLTNLWILDEEVGKQNVTE